MSAANPPRSWRSFPTRSQGYGALSLLADVPLLAGRIYRQVVGIDDHPFAMDEGEAAAQLGDPFGALILRAGVFPMTLEQLLGALDQFNDGPGGLPEQDVFVVGDGSQIPWTPETADIDRKLRFAIARGRVGQTELMISTGTNLRSDEMFLQLLAWNPEKRVYNYYLRRKPTWVWVGHSLFAFDERARGKGCFDSHVNGSLVMKERKAPWLHWHSVRASIDQALAPDDPLRDEVLFKQRKSAHVLQTKVVEAGVTRWTEERMKVALSQPGKVVNVQQLFRHLLLTTSVNLVTSENESMDIKPEDHLRLPLSFFLNSDALFDIVGLEPNIGIPEIFGSLYLQSLREFDVHLATDSRRIRSGDVHFAFAAPESAFEDLSVIQQLVARNVISRRLAACFLMVDFPNPVFSERRGALLRYIPDTAELATATSGLDNVIAAAIVDGAAGLGQDSPEAEFMKNWIEPDWKKQFEKRIETYFGAIQARLSDWPGFSDIVRLAESRRRRCRKMALLEFDLTLPRTNIPASAPNLRMTEDAHIVPEFTQPEKEQ
jgi:hypothetical protein